MTEFHIPVLDLVLTMSHAVDLINSAVSGHHRRVAYLTGHLARELELEPDLHFDLVVAAALHDIGAFSIQDRLETLQFEVEHPHTHAETGARFLETFPPFERVARLVRFHHVPWGDGSGTRFRGSEVPLGSHVLHLADRIDVLQVAQGDGAVRVDRIIDRIEAERGRTFHPDVVSAFRRFALKEFIWLDLRSPDVERILAGELTEKHLVLNGRGMLMFARLLAHLVDFRSDYTAAHTAGVAETAHYLAVQSGLDGDHCERVRLAGYLHDLGKLAVGREVLDKGARLDEEEFGIIKSHPYFTRRILERIEGFSDIARWASRHHERPDGSGYPFHEEDLPPETRMIAVADVLTALTENRPYRTALSPDRAFEELRAMARANRLDPEVVELAYAHRGALDRIRREVQAEASEHFAHLMGSGDDPADSAAGSV